MKRLRIWDINRYFIINSAHICVGKQIAAVKKSGCITQFKPDLKEIVDLEIIISYSETY